MDTLVCNEALSFKSFIKGPNFGAKTINLISRHLNLFTGVLLYSVGNLIASLVGAERAKCTLRKQLNFGDKPKMKFEIENL